MTALPPLLTITAGQRAQLHQDFGISRRRNPLLDRAMRAIRQYRPLLPPNLTHTVHVSDGVGALWLQSPACRFSLLGRCTMCDYWAGDRLQDPAQVTREALRGRTDWPSTFVLNTCGSVLDPQELNRDDLLRVLREINGVESIKLIILESHFSTIHERDLAMLLEAAPDKQIAVEFGQESVSPDVLLLSLNKPSMIPTADSPWGLSASIPAFTNVLLGAPFLTVRERINDATAAVLSALYAGAPSVILFPLNIKPYTLVHWLHRRSLYQPVRLSEILHVISNIPPNLVTRLSVAWYEGRSVTNPSYPANSLPPDPCPDCGSFCRRAIEMFNRESHSERRLAIIRQANASMCASCRSMTDQQDVRGSFFERIQHNYALISTDLIGCANESS